MDNGFLDCSSILLVYFLVSIFFKASHLYAQTKNNEELEKIRKHLEKNKDKECLKKDKECL